MSLTVGSGPFGQRPAGHFNVSIEAPEGILYFEDDPRRIRALLGKETIADSRRMKLLHESGRLPVYYFPEGDVRIDLLEPSDKTEESKLKGTARFWTVRAGGRAAPDAAWSWSVPPLAGYVALDWSSMDEWFAADDRLFGHSHDPSRRLHGHHTSPPLKASRAE